MSIFIGPKEPEVEWISGGALRLDNVWHGMGIGFQAGGCGELGLCVGENAQGRE